MQSIRSEVYPEGCVCENASKGDVLPELGVGDVALGSYFPVGKLLSVGGSGEDLTSFIISINLHEHEFA